MSEVSIIIMNVEEHLLRSRRKRLPKTHLYCLNFMCISLGDEEIKADVALIKYMYNLQMFPRRWFLTLDFFRRP